MSEEETSAVEGKWEIGGYTWKADKYLDEFVEGLKNKKIVGSFCSECGRVYVPPRYICGRCMKKIEERTEVSDKGVVLSYVVSQEMERGNEVYGTDVVEEGWVDEGERIITVMVRFFGSDGWTRMILRKTDPDDVYIGMVVKALWKKDREGEMSDLKGVVPLEEEI